MKGDCLKRMKEIPAGSVDLIITDLPYGITGFRWDKLVPFEPLWKEYKRVLKPYGVILLFGIQPFTTRIINSNLQEFSYIWYWIKNHKTGALNARKQPMKCAEEIAVFTVNRERKNGNEKATYNPQGLTKLREPKERKNNIETHYGRTCSEEIKNSNRIQTYTGFPTHLLYFNVETERFHPTQKPVDLLAYLIKTHSNEGETVLDNCMGSGSTGVACIQTGRNFIGIELDENYFQIAKGRLEKEEINK